MTAYGIPEADIARVLAIDPKTLRKHYREELDTGAIKANSKMAENLWRKALGDGPQAVSATIFWLKTRARWKETQVQEISGPDGGPLVADVTDQRELAKAIVHVLARAVPASPDLARLPPSGRDA